MGADALPVSTILPLQQAGTTRATHGATSPDQIGYWKEVAVLPKAAGFRLTVRVRVCVGMAAPFWSAWAR